MSHWTEFERIIRTMRPGAHVTVDTYREELAAAQIPPNAIGPLFRTACERGLLVTDGRCIPSRARAARGRVVRVYVRRKPEAA